MDPNAVVEQKIREQLGHLLLQNIVLQSNLEQAQKRIAELEQAAKPQEPTRLAEVA